ncbi:MULTISPECIES: substrate-binding periplasmic protein [Mesorhizobium]|uniref:substrate-binding periplasmic protein n=1 Tax=Mesorhizobium TaxID=68287 RepID=UPI0010A97A62|nr:MULTISPECIES: transporter substrate-binding domain-containing protein [Mesorhizobium]
MTIVNKVAVAAAAVIVLGTHIASAKDCKPKFKLDPVKAGVLTVALTNTPPYSFEDKSAVAGIDGDLVNSFAAANCLTVEYQIYTYPAAVSAIQSGRADVAIGGFYRTAARAKVVALSVPVYLDQIAVESKKGFESVDQLHGHAVGTIEGYAWVNDMETLFEGSRTYPSSLNLAQDVKAGRLDAGLEGFGAALMLTQGSDVQVKLLQADPRIAATTLASQTAFLLPLNNKDLIKAMDTTLTTYHGDGTVVKALETHGLPASAADVGEARVIQ